MPAKDDKLLTRLLATFNIEAREHIHAIASGLIELERAAPPETHAAVLDTTFRAAHSLKGAARTVKVTNIEILCQALEGIFAALKREDLGVSPELFDLLHRVVDALTRLLQPADTESAVVQQPGITDLVRSLQAALTGHSPPQRAESANITDDAAWAVGAAQPGAALKRDVVDTVRVTTAKLDAVLRQAEELLSVKLASALQARRLRRCHAQLADWKKKWAKLRPELRRIRRHSDGAEVSSGWVQAEEFLQWNQVFVESLEVELADLAKSADHEQRSTGMRVDGLLDDMTRVVMQPFSTLLDVLPRWVRDLSREQGKAVELRVTGDDIEIDRRILEEMKDPLIHMVRNCLDHGIEPPAARERAGKPPHAALTIGICARNGSNVELLFADDGAGIDASAVKDSAVRLGYLSPEKVQALSDQEAVYLVFQSGVSTSPIITDLSGRGLGLAIVKEKVEKLGGSLHLETRLGQGTRFRIMLPTTLARFRGLVVVAAGHLFVLPTSNVQRVVRLGNDDIKTVGNRETIALGGQAVSLARLFTVLELPQGTARKAEPATQYAVVLTSGHQRIAFVVDEVVNEQEVLVKPLGKQLARVRNVAGATILGDGKVVPVLNIADLMQSAVRASESTVRIPAAPAEAPDNARKSVLVAEDSITSRILLKNILEAAGYQVETALDGVDAFTKLRSGEFDLVVSDVDMPRLNGFGLTAKVRSERQFADLPVVLVTALESREDRERGIDVGANAYIAKSSFDQSNLLEVIRRLV